jgi:hypothetical protein
MPEIPDLTTPESTLGFIKEAVMESEAFLKIQPGYDKIGETMRAVFGEQHKYRSSRLSDTELNHLGKIASDLAALLTDIKPFWEYKTRNKSFERQSGILGKLSSHWYLERFIDLRMMEVIKYWEVSGTGWPHFVWDPMLGDLTIYAEDSRDVLPIRPPSGYISIQDAIGVAIRKEHTVNHLRSLYPQSLWPLIKPDRDGTLKGAESGQTRFDKLLQSFGVPSDSPFLRRLWGGPARQTPRIPMVDLYTVYLKDESRNTSSHPRFMGNFDKEGRAQDNYSYIVPPGGKLYPRRRRIVATSRGILSDGPNHYWHGLFPIPKMTLDPWPWSWFGKAPLWDLLKPQSSLNRALRVVDDHMEKIARPGMKFDKNSVSKAAAERYDTRRAGFKFQHNPMIGKGIEIEFPPPLPGEVPWWIGLLKDEMYDLAGVRDLSQLMRLNQVPAADTIEKITASMTASVRGRSRAMEAFMREFGTMAAYNFAQFRTMTERYAILGEDGVTKEDWDFDPGSLIPDYVHSDDFEPNGIVRHDALVRGPLPRLDRAREVMRHLSFDVAPGSLLAASQIESKMMYLQLARAGLIDHWTLLEKLEVPNVGLPPSGADTITERLQAEQQMGLGMAISATGRKASGQSAPRMTVKESG